MRPRYTRFTILGVVALSVLCFRSSPTASAEEITTITVKETLRRGSKSRSREREVTDTAELPLSSTTPNGTAPSLPPPYRYTRSEEAVTIKLSGKKTKAKLIRWRRPKDAPDNEFTRLLGKEVRWYVVHGSGIPPYNGGTKGAFISAPANCVRAELEPISKEFPSLRIELKDPDVSIKLSGRTYSGAKFSQTYAKGRTKGKGEFVLCKELPGNFYSLDMKIGSEKMSVVVSKVERN